MFYLRTEKLFRSLKTSIAIVFPFPAMHVVALARELDGPCGVKSREKSRQLDLIAMSNNRNCEQLIKGVKRKWQRFTDRSAHDWNWQIFSLLSQTRDQSSRVCHTQTLCRSNPHTWSTQRYMRMHTQT